MEPLGSYPCRAAQALLLSGPSAMAGPGPLVQPWLLRSEL
jgi:hypothetical protein